MRLNMVVEGQTEETFVERTLGPYLLEHGIYARPCLVATSPHSRGGMTTYAKARRDMLHWMREDQTACLTTMFDYYRLPADWPGRDRAAAETGGLARVRALEAALAADIDSPRLVPYLQLHEFEALLLAHPSALLGPHPEAEDAVVALAEAVERAGGPELVDDGPDTHPSKRIQALIPRYQKPVSGPEAAAAISIDRMRQACPHFDEWIEKLTALGRQPSAVAVRW